MTHPSKQFITCKNDLGFYVILIVVSMHNKDANLRCSGRVKSADSDRQMELGAVTLLYPQIGNARHFMRLSRSFGA